MRDSGSAAPRSRPGGPAGGASGARTGKGRKQTPSHGGLTRPAPQTERSEVEERNRAADQADRPTP